MKFIITNTFDTFNHNEFERIYSELCSKFKVDRVDFNDYYEHSVGIIEINYLEELFDLYNECSREIIISKGSNYEDYFDYGDREKYEKYKDMYVI